MKNSFYFMIFYINYSEKFILKFIFKNEFLHENISEVKKVMSHIENLILHFFLIETNFCWDK